MSRVSIDHTLCARCGTCAERCPACFRSTEEGVSVRDDGARCIACGHCIALCPTDAVSHEALRPEAFGPAPELTIDSAQFRALIRHRRSHRHFADRPVPDRVLTELLESCRYAPTGVNAQAVAVHIIRTPSQVRAAAKLAVDHLVASFETMEAEAAAHTRGGRAIPDALKERIHRSSRYRKMGASFEKGWDPIFHKAPAVLLFHAPEGAPTPRDDCVIAAHTAVLHAEILGLGTCYIGLFTRALRENRNIAASLPIPEGNQVFAALILGYPRLCFLKTPPRAPLDVSWG